MSITTRVLHQLDKFKILIKMGKNKFHGGNKRKLEKPIERKELTCNLQENSKSNQDRYVTSLPFTFKSKIIFILV